MIEYASKPSRKAQQAAIQWLVENCVSELEASDVAGLCEKVADDAPIGLLGYDARTNLAYVLNDLCEDKLLESIGEKIPEKLFYRNTLLKAVTIPSNIKSIGNAAFFACDGLKSVIISDSVTAIGNVAFSHCSSLSSIIIPNSVTSIGE